MLTQTYAYASRYRLTSLIRDITKTSDNFFEDNEEEKDLLGLVAETTGFVGTSRPDETDNGRLLAILPAPNPLHKPHHIRLLLPP